MFCTCRCQRVYPHLPVRLCCLAPWAADLRIKPARLPPKRKRASGSRDIWAPQRVGETRPNTRALKLSVHSGRSAEPPRYVDRAWAGGGQMCVWTCAARSPAAALARIHGRYGDTSHDTYSSRPRWMRTELSTAPPRLDCLATGSAVLSWRFSGESSALSSE